MIAGFPQALVPAIICQKCQGALTPSSKDEHIEDGALMCRTCSAHYPIKNGILYMLHEGDLDDVLKSEIKSRDNEASAYDRKYQKARYEKEILPTLRKIGDVSGKRIIEYAAGTGRVSEYIAEHADMLLAIDFSVESLKVYGKKDLHATIGLVYADATAILTKDDFFDIALSTQFYEHIPTHESRHDFLSHAFDTLKSEAVFICTAYHFDLRRRMRQLPQEGMHRTNIFYHFLTTDELANDVKRFFKIMDIHPIDITLPFEARLKLSPKLGGIVSRYSEHIPILNKFGHLLIVVAHK